MTPRFYPRLWCKLFITSVFIGLIIPSGTNAQQWYIIDSEQSTITGSIRYSILGVYKAEFEQFSGDVYIDLDNAEKNSVQMVIMVDTIQSKHPRFDRIVRSKRLLDVDQFPTATFKSNSFLEMDDGEYLVTGDLNLHGVTKTITFRYQQDQAAAGYFKAQGKWKIKRKDFGVIWHKWFDRGGIIVGNTITVDWEVTAVAE